MTSSEKAKDRRLQKTYKLTLEQQNEQLKEQDYECEICGRPFPPKHDEKGKTFTPQQDHDHKCCPRRLKQFCGLCNRGLICYPCNKFVVGVIERLNIPIEKVAAYIKKWGAILISRGAYEPKLPIKKIRKRKRKAKK
jgi:recombination endonuclease VII